jgi:hypothetical protein
MDKDTKDFLDKVGKEATNPQALFMAEILSRVSALYVGFIDNAYRQDKNMGTTMMAMINSGIIRCNSNSTDEAIRTIDILCDKMKDMVIQVERGVNGLPLNPKLDNPFKDDNQPKE